MKKYFLLLFIGSIFCGVLQAQQLTRFAVVDLPRVYMAFFSESRAVRDFEARSAQVQAEIDRMTNEIQNLRVSMVNAEAQGNIEQAFRLEAEVNRRTTFLMEFYQTRTAELENIRNNLIYSGSFLDQVYDELRFVAESEGFSMVINLRENTGILWYSPTVDITDRLIQRLMSRSGR